MMRFFVSLLVLPAIFLTSCANEGVIVRKESAAMPMYHTLGMEGSYSFYLRDKAGAVHRQIVSPDVFARYSEGDYFNDLQAPPPPPQGIDDFEALRPRPRVAMHQPTFSLKRTAKRTTTASKSTRVAAKSQKSTSPKRVATSKKTTAKRIATSTAKSKAKVQQAQRSVAKAKAIRTAAAPKSKKATKRAVAKASRTKPFKVTQPSAQSLPTSDAPAPVAEGPAAVPPQPAASPAADIVSINPGPR